MPERIILNVNLHIKHHKDNWEHEKTNHVESYERNQVNAAWHYDLHQEPILIKHS